MPGARVLLTIAMASILAGPTCTNPQLRIPELRIRLLHHSKATRPVLVQRTGVMIIRPAATCERLARPHPSPKGGAAIS